MKSVGRLLLGLGLFALPFTPQAQQALSSTQTTDGTSSDSIVQLTAEAQGLTPVAPQDLPETGTFWVVTPEAGGLAPWPCLPSTPGLPIYAINGNSYLVDLTGGLVDTNGMDSTTVSIESALEAQAQAVVNVIDLVQGTQLQMATLSSTSTMMAMDSPESEATMMMSVVDTNSLYLELTNVAAGWSYLNLHNGTNQVYCIQGCTNLSAPDWTIEQEVWPGDTNCEPFTVATQNRDILFLRALDWTGVDANTNGLLDWWEWKYFGGFNQTTNGDYDNDGVNIGYEYAHGIDPNKIQFSVIVTNDLVSSLYVPVQLDITGGVPSQISVVDSTNFIPVGTTWYPYVSSSFVVNLAATDGVHQIWIGLKGRPTDAQQTWQSAIVTLDTTPPVILPASQTVTTTNGLLQLTGTISEPLSSIHFDVANVATTNLNQIGYVMGAQVDATSGKETTNQFQCFDILLAPGTNLVNVRASDFAGNVATNVYTYVLDVSGHTAPPVITVQWPENNAKISGANYTVHGTLDDPTTKIELMTVVSGVTNTIAGSVARDGQFWIENVPLPDGTNQFTLTAQDIAGNTSSVTQTVSKSAVTLTINPVNPAGLTQATVTVSGTIASSGYAVSVNGVAATVSPDGNGVYLWSVDVPLSPGGNVSISANATLTGGSAPDAEATQFADTPSLVQGTSYHEQLNAQSFNHFYSVYTAQEISGTRSWTKGSGGEVHAYQAYQSTGYTMYENVDFDWTASWPPEAINLSDVSSDGNIDFDFTYFFSFPLEHCEQWGDGPPCPDLPVANLTTHDCNYSCRKADTRMELKVGGKGILDQSQLVMITASVNDNGVLPIPAEDILVNGQKLVDTGDGYGVCFQSFPTGTNVDVTPRLVNYKTSYYSFTVAATNVDFQMAADNNRDGQITFDSSDQTTADNPYRFWINDAQEQGDVSEAANATPGSSSPNYALNHVNGRADLVNFFPVALNLNDVLQYCPLTNGFEYHLAQADSAVKFVYTGLSQGNAFDYLTDATNNTGYGVNTNEAAWAADTIQVSPSSAAGTVLDANWLANVQANGSVGIILMEGAAATTQPLNLEIWKNGQKLGGVPLYLSIDGIEKMYRQINLRFANANPADPGQPPNYPDSLCNGKQVIFIHGFSVGQDDARGWNAEVFKRLYQARSHAMFTGVDWQGDQSAWFDASGKLDYYDNVKNAFLTASNFNVAVSGLPGGQKYIIAHSLGNMVVSSAIKDFGLSVNSYFALDAAVATEAYDGNNSFLDMVNFNAFSTFDGWTNYDQSLWASSWHNLFSSGDGRAGLTWVNRFGVIGNFYNFYSSGEDVLKNSDGSYPDGIATVWAQHELVWVYQEMSKGNLLTSLTSSGSQAGWELNTYWYVLPDGAPPGGNTFPRRRYQANLADYTDNTDTSGHINTNSLPTNPFFEVFNDSQVMDASAGSAEAAKFDVRADILGGGIPALSHATGANSVQAFEDRNFDLMSMETGWPQARLDIQRLNNRWLHSDFEEVSYPYVHSLYENIVNLGGFSQ